MITDLIVALKIIRRQCLQIDSKDLCGCDQCPLSIDGTCGITASQPLDWEIADNVKLFKEGRW